MEVMSLCIIAFLLVLAVFDLSVGVSNDAVNFLNSAIGSKAASFKKIIIVASVGVFLGAVMSNGMIDIARHGIFHPQYFSFYEVLCIFMAVMIVDIILLDVFNTLAMPTSTTVSMVFELLGASFAVALFKVGDNGLSLGALLNTEKALTIIMGIFLSVVIAFIFGTVVQFIVRLIFTFKYKVKGQWGVGLYGGLVSTIILYFLLIKGAKGLTFMTAEVNSWISGHIVLVIGGCFVISTLIMYLLNALRVNVLRILVLMGTFSLAMAFAGNDLVNFIGVPLTGLASFLDFTRSGAGDANSFMMSSLNAPANTPAGFLIGAGVIMVIALTHSRKARNVAKTEIGLGSQKGGEEMFGSSKVARQLVRTVLQIFSFIRRYMPKRLTEWFNERLNADDMVLENGASFDLVRGSVNMMLAALLIALGTSLKLPLSTTFVTFMVAMGTSLSDRAWGRESAVFRITGVISVIGGWFITAGAAFICAAIIASLMFWGGKGVIVLLGLLAIMLLVRSNRKSKEQKAEEGSDILFQTILTTKEDTEKWRLFRLYVMEEQTVFLEYAVKVYNSVVYGFINDDVRALWKCNRTLTKEKAVLKTSRRKQTLCLRELNKDVVFEKNAWFHLANNSCMAMSYNVRRINEACLEHVDNNFFPLPERYKNRLKEINESLQNIMSESITAIRGDDKTLSDLLRNKCNALKDSISQACRIIYDNLQREDTQLLAVTYVYLNLLQETQEMVSSLRKLLRASIKLQYMPYNV